MLVVVKKGSMQAATTIQKAQEKGENNPCALVPMPMQADCRTGSAAGAYSFCCCSSLCQANWGGLYMCLSHQCFTEQFR